METRTACGAIYARCQMLARIQPESAGKQNYDQEDGMSRLRVLSFGMSLDGYGAGACQSLENPLRVGGLARHEWAFKTRTFNAIHAKDGGETGVDDDFVARGFCNFGSQIIGRNMFGPVRGPWPDDTWKRWWGDDPPFHTPVFILTNHARGSLTMKGGTTVHFLTNGIQDALTRAREAAGGGSSFCRNCSSASE
jgi:dihydrofolate reductase